MLHLDIEIFVKSVMNLVAFPLARIQHGRFSPAAEVHPSAASLSFSAHQF
jgi:hypothetical protein